jgi:hypothetical protein
MRPTLALLAAFAAGFAVCYALTLARPKVIDPLAPGSRVTLTYPTGEYVTGAGGTGDTAPVRKTVPLAVRRVYTPGNSDFSAPGTFVPWVLAVGETRYVLAPANE